MNNSLYNKVVKRDDNAKVELVLTEEANRIILWLVQTDAGSEDEVYTVVKTFSKYETNAAIEFAVKTAGVHVEEGKHQLLTVLAAILNGKEWSGDQLEQIAMVLLDNGYEVRAPGEDEEDEGPDLTDSRVAQALGEARGEQPS